MLRRRSELITLSGIFYNDFFPSVIEKFALLDRSAGGESALQCLSCV